MGFNLTLYITISKFCTFIFFIPNSLDVNRYTYTKNNFYNDLKTNIRLTTPVYLLREIAEGDNSPIHFHAVQTMDALKAGKHVACTVPMALTVDECSEIVKLQKETGEITQGLCGNLQQSDHECFR